MTIEEYNKDIEYFTNILIKSSGIPRRFFMNKKEERKKKLKKLLNI